MCRCVRLPLVLTAVLAFVLTPTHATAAPASVGPGPAAAVVATQPVAPDVRQVAVRRVAGPATARAGVVARSRPVRADGFAAAGAVWRRGAAVPGQRFWLRTRDDGSWTRWEALHTEPGHGPDPGSAEAARARPGTDPYVVGDVDAVQLQVSAGAGARAPAGLRLVVVDPGAAVEGSQRVGSPAYPATQGGGTATGRPGIFSRAQWGADESMRNGFAGYGTVTGSFVHHTVNANDYSAAQVPAILRAIYAYHVQGRHWSDIGYNYLVDRFGRIWEGRWGGVGRPVIGAHTLGYNEEAFAMSAIGNYDLVRPSDALLAAYRRLYAWKLSLHGIAADAEVRIDGTAFHAINGHRDAAATACPGSRLYAALGGLRAAAAGAQHAWSGRGLGRSVVDGPRPDLLVRNGARLRILAGDAGQADGAQATTGAGVHHGPRIAGRWASYSWLRIVGDWDGDGDRDLMGRQDGRMWLFPGLGEGRFGGRVGGWAGWGTRTLLTPVGDWNGDGRPDLAARAGGAVRLFPGRGRHGLGTGYVLRSDVGQAGRMLGVGRWTGDGAPDLMTRDAAGSLWLWPGNGPGGLLDRRRVATGADRYDLMLGVGDLDRDGDPDLVGRAKAGGRLFLLPGAPGGDIGRRVPLTSRALVGDLLG